MQFHAHTSLSSLCEENTHLFIVVHVVVQLSVSRLSHDQCSYSENTRVPWNGQRVSFIHHLKLDPSLSLTGVQSHSVSLRRGYPHPPSTCPPLERSHGFWLVDWLYIDARVSGQLSWFLYHGVTVQSFRTICSLAAKRPALSNNAFSVICPL